MANYKTVEKLALENRCRMLGCKYRGDIPRIVKELRATFPNMDHRVITLKYVGRVLNKYKDQEVDGSPLVATWVIEYLIEGIRQRQVEWSDEADLLEQSKYINMSYCCNKVAVQHTFDELPDESWLCTSCLEACQVRRTVDIDVLRFLRTSRIEKRKDDAALAKAIEDIGYGKQSGATQNTFQAVLPGARPEDCVPKRIDSTQIPAPVQTVVKDMNALSPMDRAVFAGQIQQSLDDVVSGKTEIEEDEDATTEHKEDNSGGCEQPKRNSG